MGARHVAPTELASGSSPVSINIWPLRGRLIMKAELSRRDFLSTALAAPILVGTLRTANAAGEVITFKSPNGQVQFVLFTTGPQLRFQITRATRVIVKLSQLG